jgi:hypothetical protein
LALKIEPDPIILPGVASESLTFTHFVSRNYPPFIVPDPVKLVNQNLSLSTSKKPITIGANAGHISESQDMYFEKCKSSRATVLEVKCYAILLGQGVVLLKPKSAGVARVTLQINDNQTERASSPEVQFDVTVTP